MMNPADFISLALRLSASAGEAELRSAVSRAYYGAFHIARQLVESCGIIFANSGETHEKLPFCLDASEEEALIEVANNLRWLRRMRNLADYELSDARFSTPSFVKVQVTKAIEVVTILSRFEADTAAIAEPIRQYAKNVLRLNVIDEP